MEKAGLNDDSHLCSGGFISLDFNHESEHRHTSAHHQWRVLGQ
ncbi:hypothetical protein JCM19241_2575 [Vibrio ishigakensis]|uniref:Uncharacterized protein n=1 Tax=Vibrio ishigakensis TaxID=1481914 RepID=A0A0B8Q0S7_9VIBR|nr:hypothetical protein JCM19241_2575 [Vibrio ishigakensis]